MCPMSVSTDVLVKAKDVYIFVYMRLACIRLSSYKFGCLSAHVWTSVVFQDTWLGVHVGGRRVKDE